MEPRSKTEAVNPAGEPGPIPAATPLPYPEPVPALARRFEAVVFDWDGTAVPDRLADASRVRALVEALCAAGMHVAVVSGTHVGNVDGQLAARPGGSGRLWLLLNRGSEVFEVTGQGPRLAHRRQATPQEEAALDEAARLAVEHLAGTGLETEIVSSRLNRRKIDLIPTPEWADPPKARIADLLGAVTERLAAHGIASLKEAASIADRAAGEAGLTHPRVTSDAKHLEIGLTDKADSARYLARTLLRLGVGPGLVAVAGDEFGPLGELPGSDRLLLVPELSRSAAFSVGAEPTGVPVGVAHLPGGPERFLAFLQDQLDRRAGGEVPGIDPDPGWTVVVEGIDPELERVHEAWLSLADGVIGTSGSPLGSHPSATPRTIAAGLYDTEGPDTALLELPVWHHLPCEIGPRTRLTRTLDLRAGLLRQEQTSPGGRLDALQLSCLAAPGTTVLRASGPTDLLCPGQPLMPAPGTEPETQSDGSLQWMRMRTSAGGAVVAAGETRRAVGDLIRMDRLACYLPDPEGVPAPETALGRLLEARESGFDRLLSAHREAWAARWQEAEVTIEGDPDLAHAVRFNLFHLMASVPDTEEAAVGARGLSGPAYRGHVFWDADIFVLPFLAATHPAAARAMLEYRIRRLPAALASAAAEGRSGARFPWESARSGADVTPRYARDMSGRIVPIVTGLLEDHIVADVAWAAACYVDWTGDNAFRDGPGRPLIIETARYWASRIRIDAEGRGHIDAVVGPDEYHEWVDDNAYTNVMARWNLRRAAREAARHAGDVTGGERARWLDLAERIVEGYDPARGLYEQFAGFWGLEPLVIGLVVPSRPIAADLLLGRQRIHMTQVIKQADVLMLHHLVPEETVPGSFLPNLRFYEPRTAHGSSLSPGIHASLYAKAGMLEQATALLRIAARLDLDDRTGTTGAGLRLAAMGSVWQALAFGFLGLKAEEGGVLRVDPHVPEAWGSLGMNLRHRGVPVRVHARPEALTVEAGSPVRLRVGGEEAAVVETAGLELRREGGGWEPGA